MIIRRWKETTSIFVPLLDRYELIACIDWNRMDNKKKNKIIVIALSFVFPTLLMIIYCSIRGVYLSDLYIPASYNNDCVFYYQMVNATANYGRPLGYFGYNESRAVIGGYGVWGPLIVVPWSIWGRLFGWNDYSGLICNVFLVSIGFAFFSYLSGIKLKNLLSIVLCLLFFPSFHINVLNLLPESIFLFLLLLYLGIAFRINNHEAKISYLLFMVVVCALLTLIRPYFVLFFILVIYFSFKLKNNHKTLWQIFYFLCPIVSLIGYFIISRYFASEYFSQSFNYSLLDFLFRGDFRNFIGYSIFLLNNFVGNIISYVKDAFSYGLTIGTNYFAVIISILILIPLCIVKSDSKYKNIYIVYMVSCICLFFAEAFFAQRAPESGRHFWCYAIVGIILVCLNDWNVKGMFIPVIPLVFFVFFCIKGAFVPTDYDIPIINREAVYNVESWRNAFRNIDIISDDVGYDNTVIWVIGDYVGDTLFITEYNELYALPAGAGISCCYPDYVIGNIDSIKSRYILTVPGGMVSGLCEEKGFRVIYQNEYAVMFGRY